MPESTPCRLIRLTPYPPGGFPFSEVVNGVEMKIPCIGLDFASQAREVLKFRRGNGLPRATFEECFDDLNTYTCRRLGCDPAHCSDGTRPTANMAPIPVSKCSSCGAKV